MQDKIKKLASDLMESALRRASLAEDEQTHVDDHNGREYAEPQSTEGPPGKPEDWKSTPPDGSEFSDFTSDSRNMDIGFAIAPDGGIWQHVGNNGADEVWIQVGSLVSKEIEQKVGEFLGMN